MAVPGEDKIIRRRFFPPLTQLALAQIVLPWLLEFDHLTLRKVFMDIEFGVTTNSENDSQKYFKEKRAKEKLLFIPAHLRHSVFKTFMGMFWSVQDWAKQQTCITFNKSDGFNLFWRSDGKFDSLQTVKYLVLNEKN